jgi:hypothetical protein
MPWAMSRAFDLLKALPIHELNTGAFHPSIMPVDDEWIAAIAGFRLRTLQLAHLNIAHFDSSHFYAFQNLEGLVLDNTNLPVHQYVPFLRTLVRLRSFGFCSCYPAPESLAQVIDNLPLSLLQLALYAGNAIVAASALRCFSKTNDLKALHTFAWFTAVEEEDAAFDSLVASLSAGQPYDATSTRRKCRAGRDFGTPIGE